MAQIERRKNNRFEVLLDTAARQFASKGYRGTTVRSISQDIGMLPGSIYYHFASKADLLLAVYEEGVKRITANVSSAFEEFDDPWTRLEAAVAAHLDSVLDATDYARVIIRVVPDEAKELETRLTEYRDQYESVFVELIDALPLSAGINRTMFRLMLLGAINWAQVWYRPNSESPEKIAKSFINLMKNSTVGTSTN